MYGGQSAEFLSLVLNNFPGRQVAKYTRERRFSAALRLMPFAIFFPVQRRKNIPIKKILCVRTNAVDGRRQGGGETP